MLKEEDEAVLGEPDGVLLVPTVSAQLEEFLSRFTVPLLFFKGELKAENLREVGSGVLVKLQDRGFILTAGHCVRAFENATGCAIVVAKEPHRFCPTFGRTCYHFSEAKGIDFGFLEIPPAELASYQAHDRIPAGSRRLLVTTPDELVVANDWHVIAGYPGKLAEHTDAGYGARILLYATTLAGLGPAPTSTLPRPTDGMRIIDLWVALRSALQTFPELSSDAAIPIFRGASGGGCWKSGVRPVPPPPEKFDPNTLRLAAIHVASSGEIDFPGAGPSRFAREVLIGHHLRLIADEIPEVRRYIFEEWPILLDPSWSVPGP